MSRGRFTWPQDQWIEFKESQNALSDFKFADFLGKVLFGVFLNGTKMLSQ